MVNGNENDHIIQGFGHCDRNCGYFALGFQQDVIDTTVGDNACQTFSIILNGTKLSLSNFSYHYGQGKSSE
jgi:hypothetical protein